MALIMRHLNSLNILNFIRFFVFGVSCIFFIFCTGCTDEQAAENQMLRDRIIEIHDDAMAKINHIYNLEQQLQALSELSETQTIAVREAIENLQLADKMMFDWMRQYQTLAVDETIQVENDYRKTQLELITTVKTLTDTSIQSAEDLLGEIAVTPQQ